jgi:uncharacterized phage-like protein YoqJ
METLIPVITRENTCCFSGYRPEKLPWRCDESDVRCTGLKRRMAEALEFAYEAGKRHFVCGMARGCDTYFCERVLDLREKRPGVTLEAAVPNEAQPDGWPEADRRRYRELLRQCDYRTVVSTRRDRSSMHARNRYMVGKSSMLIAVYDGKPGGTAYTVRYAGKRGLEEIILGFVDVLRA